MFPNAYKIREVDGPDASLTPWFNIIFLTILGLFAWGIYRRIQIFRQKRIDPVLEDMGESLEEQRGRFSRWFGR